MKYHELMKISMDNYRKNGFISHVLFFFLSLLAAAFSLLGIFYIDLFLLIIPFFVIPTLFSAMLATRLLREQNYMTLRGFFTCFGNYFTNKFNSTFRVIRSALISFLVYVAIGIIISLSVNLYFYYSNYMGYQVMINEFLAYNELSVDGLYVLIDKYTDLINHVLIYTTVPSLSVFVLSFMFLTTKNSVTLFDRLDSLELNGRVNAIVQQNLVKKNFKEYTGAFIKLNWPLFVLFSFGFVGGGFLAYYQLATYASVFTVGLAAGIFVSFGLYGPFFLANQEAIYISFKDRYLFERDALKEQFTASLEKMFEEMKKREEETKKDSDES